MLRVTVPPIDNRFRIQEDGSAWSIAFTVSKLPNWKKARMSSWIPLRLTCARQAFKGG